MNWIHFGIYLSCILALFVFIAIVVMHISEFRQYSRYINPVLRIYVILIIVIALFGGYVVLMDDGYSGSIKTSPSTIKLEF